MRAALFVAGSLLASVASVAFAEPRPASSPAPAPTPIERSMSSSGQFVIYFPDGEVRGRLARETEDLKKEWLEGLKLKDEWTAPIIIQVLSANSRPLQPDAPHFQTRLYESDAGKFKVQINVYDPASLRTVDFALEVYRALCLEYAHRKTPPQSGKPHAQPPAWLIEGLFANAMAQKNGVPAELFEMLVRSGPPPELKEFLRQNPERMEDTSRRVYRAQAMGLLRALLAMPDGPAHLAEYLQDLPDVRPDDPGPLLKRFPELDADPAKLSKIWTLSLANASASDRVKPLSMRETRTRLEQIFDISAPKDPDNPQAGKVRGPEALTVIAQEESGRFTLGQMAATLLRLELHAHPIMRPVIEEYRSIVSILAVKPRKNLEKRIRKNKELYDAVAARTQGIEDYLNWFETSQLAMPSQENSNALELRDPEKSFQRTDALSRELDALEARGW